MLHLSVAQQLPFTLSLCASELFPASDKDAV